MLPEKLDRCVEDLKTKGDVDNPWAVCNASISKTKESKIQEKINANRQVPVFNPPIKKGKVEPQNDKTTKGIGGQTGKIDSTKNPMNPTLWKQIFDSQLRRNVKEPKI